MSAYARVSTLRIKSVSNAPGYRDLTLTLEDDAGKLYELRVPPADMSRLIYGCADAVKQIGVEPPIDWDLYPSTIHWPEIREWRPGQQTAGAKQ